VIRSQSIAIHNYNVISKLSKVYLSIMLIVCAAFFTLNPGGGRCQEKTTPAPALPEKRLAGRDEKKEGAEEPYHVEADVTEGYYSAGNQVLHGVGNVVIVHGGTTITCDEAYSYEADKLATLLGNVRVRNKEQKYTLTSGYAEYRRDEKLSVATKNPRLVLERDRPVTITADIMRLWADDDYGEAAGDVKIVSEDVEGYGQKLKRFGKEDRIELSGKPVVHQKDSRLAGDLITLFLEGEKLRRAVADGSARLLYFSRAEEKEEEAIRKEEEQVESAVQEEAGVGAEYGEELFLTGAEAEGETISTEVTAEGVETDAGEESEEPPSGRVEASGDTMEGFFTDGVLDHVDIVGDAEGHYWPFDEFGRETGEKVDAAGDLIRVNMNDGEVKKIIVEGNAEGVYRPSKTEGRSGVTQTAGDRISVFVTDSEVRRIVVFGRARGSYFTEETPAAKKSEGSGG
jgi:lipopolysaccharide export system protein LptA